MAIADLGFPVAIRCYSWSCNSQKKRKSAKIFENLRKTANLALFVPFSLTLLIPLDLRKPPFMGKNRDHRVAGLKARAEVEIARSWRPNG